MHQYFTSEANQSLTIRNLRARKLDKLNEVKLLKPTRKQHTHIHTERRNPFSFFFFNHAEV